jgi:hypothetical protein
MNIKRLLKEGLLTTTPAGGAVKAQKILKWIGILLVGIIVLLIGCKGYRWVTGPSDDGSCNGAMLPTEEFASEHAKARFVADQKNKQAEANCKIAIADANQRADFVKDHVAPYVNSAKYLGKNLNEHTYSIGMIGERKAERDKAAMAAITGPKDKPRYGSRGVRVRRGEAD